MNWSMRWSRMALAAGAAVPLAATTAGAGDHVFKHGHAVPVYVTQAPMSFVSQAPVAYTAQAPVTYTAQAPVSYTAQAPVAYTAQAPVTYTAQAPATFTAQAPVTYAAQAPVTYTAQAPTMFNPAAAAPATAAAPTDSIRLSQTLLHALYSDLVAFYHSGESGTTRIEKIKAVRDRARQEYLDLLGDDEDSELNQLEKDHLDSMVDAVISAAPSGRARAPYVPYTAPAAAPYPTGAVVPTGYVTVAPMSGYLVPLVPVRPVHPHHLKKF